MGLQVTSCKRKLSNYNFGKGVITFLQNKINTKKIETVLK